MLTEARTSSHAPHRSNPPPVERVASLVLRISSSCSGVYGEKCKVSTPTIDCTEKVVHEDAVSVWVLAMPTSRRHDE